MTHIQFSPAIALKELHETEEWKQFCTTTTRLRDQLNVTPFYPIFQNISCDLNDVLISTCIMEKSGQCIVSKVADVKSDSWTQCDKCQSWYHCVCIGMVVTERDEFVCCSAPMNNKVLVYNYWLMSISYSLLYIFFQSK